MLDEIKYELEIRAMGFVNEKQAIRSLRARLREEIQDISLRPNVSTLAPEEDIPVCYAKMLELVEYTILKVFEKDIRLRTQIYSRLCHLEKRLARIDAQEVSKVPDLPSTLEVLTGKVITIRTKFYPTKPLYRPNSSIIKTSTEVDEEEDESIIVLEDDLISDSEEIENPEASVKKL
jgi:hypothetical protein